MRQPRTARVSAVALVALVLAGCGGSGGGSGYPGTAGDPEPSGPVEETFAVPTYEWDGGAGNDALVAGTLAMTADGCPLLVDGTGADARATAVFFPNARGVRYDNGVRAVVDDGGRVYAVEGGAFSYAGGWTEPANEDFTAAWDELCADTPLRDAAVINEDPADPPRTSAPEPPPSGLPTAPSTAEELGYYAVPTFEWDPAEGGDAALLEGVVSFDDGCPVVEADERRIGLVLPNAEGYRPDGGPMVYASFPDGTTAVVAAEGERISYGGGFGAADDPLWTDLCPAVDEVFYVQDTPF